MNTSRLCMVGLAGLAGGLLIAAAVGDNIHERNAIAQVTPAGTARYQVSAFGTGGNLYGCYIVDTETGAMWHTVGGVAPKKISDKLP